MSVRVYLHTVDKRILPICYIAPPIPKKKFHIRPTVGDLDPHLIHGSMGPPDPPLQTVYRSSHPFFPEYTVVDWTNRQNDRVTQPEPIAASIATTAMRLIILLKLLQN